VKREARGARSGKLPGEVSPLLHRAAFNVQLVLCPLSALCSLGLPIPRERIEPAQALEAHRNAKAEI